MNNKNQNHKSFKHSHQNNSNDAISSLSVSFLERMDEATLCKFVSQYPQTIKSMSKPSENIQKACINNNPIYIQYINKPSENIQLAVVSINWKFLRYIKKPSERVQLVALKQHKDAYTLIKNPTDLIKKKNQELWIDNNINNKV